MVEGPTAKLIAERIERHIAGRRIKSVFSRKKGVAEKLEGRQVEKVFAHGKNIIILAEDAAVRIHLMMWGSVRFYPHGEEIEKPWRQVRLVLETEEGRLVVFNAPVVEVDRREELLKRLYEDYGPDPLSTGWDREAVLKAMDENPQLTVSQFLLSQRFIAGVGNIIRNEVLFRCRLHPEEVLGNLSAQEKERLLRETEEFIAQTYLLKKQGKRWGTVMLIYRKKRCPVCGGPVKRYYPPDVKRLTFFCPSCQPKKQERH